MMHKPTMETTHAAGQASDADIVARVLAGDTDAYRLLVERYQRAVFSCAYQLLSNRDLAEEAAQEAFVQAFEKLSRLREPRYFFSWVWRICSTVALKSRLRSRRVALGLDDESARSSPMPSRLEEHERNQQLTAALGELPDDQREALTLRFWEGMDYGTMAGLLGLSHDALYQRVSRGLRTLKEKLGPEFTVE